MATTLRVPSDGIFLQPRPRFLADGRHFVLTTTRTSYLGEIGQDSLRLLSDQFVNTTIVAGGE